MVEVPAASVWNAVAALLFPAPMVSGEAVIVPVVGLLLVTVMVAVFPTATGSG